MVLDGVKGRARGEYGMLWLIVIGAWAVMGIFIGIQDLAFAINFHQVPELWRTLSAELLYVTLWAALAPLSLLLVRRFSLSRRNWWWVLPLHLAAGMACSAATNLARLSLYALFLPGRYGPLQWPAIVNFMNMFFDNGLMSYLFNTVVCFAYEYNRVRRERERRAMLLESQLVNAQLQTLKSQLHPHFLFNALNSVAMLIRQGKRTKALETLTGLADFLRGTIEDFHTQTLPLERELALLERYLKIQQVRFGDRLTVRLAVSDDCRHAEVPGLILQPLVENAFQHGIAKRLRAGEVAISARREGDRLAIAISDDGPGLAADWPKSRGNGIGLANTEARLEKLYSGKYSLSLSNRQPYGAEVRLSLPFRTCPLPAEAG